MDRAERELFAKGVQDAVARAGALDVALGELGWTEALAVDAQVAVGALFDAQGRSAVTSGALDVVLAQALGADVRAVVLPPFGRTTAPGQVQDGAVTVAGLATSRAAEGPLAAVCTGADGLVVAVLDAGAVERRVISGLDPALGLVEITGAPPRATTVPLAPAAWDDAVAAGQRALVHELVGASAAMLDLARAHALDRIQFGVPIASFQAVRHRLADSLVAVEAARGALDAAWEAGSSFDAAIAKALAGRAARLVAKHAQQVLAGIGFTLEHPLHRYVRRVRVLDGLLGDARTLTHEIGDRLLSDRALPAILPLTAS